MTHFVDVAVVGGGILGLAFAWESARRGRTVALFERDRQAQGASVRNFGMVWPIGQPQALQSTAMKSRERWLELKNENVCWVNPCGSLHVAMEDDENSLLQEFAILSEKQAVSCNYLSAQEIRKRFPSVTSPILMGGLFSPWELAVDPRQAIARIPDWLKARHNVDCLFQSTVTEIAKGSLRTATGESWQAKEIFIASGIDFETLFPDRYRALGLSVCKLQMMRTVPQPNDWRLGPHLAGGLTLTHYKSFEVCSALSEVKRRVAETMPEYVKYGIHVMASQNELGEVIIGDSHEYNSEISHFDKPSIDDLILKYLRTILRLPDESIAARWHGFYAKHPTKALVMESPLPGVTLLAAPGGAGMTLSFGFARDWWDAREPKAT